MKLCHKIEGLAAKKGVGERTSVRPGKPPPLHVTTVTRKAHNLTLITGLENYGTVPPSSSSLGQLSSPAAQSY